MKVVLATLSMLLTQLFGTTPTPTLSPTPSPLPELFSYQSIEYQIHAYQVSNVAKLSLGSNLDSKTRAQDLAGSNQCRFLINGGFYDKDDNHLGWFVNQSVTTKDRPSRLFDGYLSVASDSAKITTTTQPKVTWGLQSGPILVMEGKPRPLTISNDESRRRMVALLTSDKTLWFLGISQPQSSLGGPPLEDTGELVMAWADTKNITVNAALNLDGGSASAFISPDSYLREYNPIGSFICESL